MFPDLANRGDFGRRCAKIVRAPQILLFDVLLISHFRIEQKTGSSRLFGGTKINNMPNMASRKFSYIPKVLCAA